MRLLVTGASGLIGWRLAETAARRGEAVRAWTRSLATTDWPVGVAVAAIGVTDRAAMAADLAAFQPEVIVHLSAQSLPGASWNDPAGTYEANLLGTIQLIEAARQLPKPPRILFAGSSAEYAEPDSDRLIGEGAPLDTSSPYGGSKLAAEEFARLCIRRYGLDIVFFRPFLVVGPRKKGDVCSDFARRVVAIERGKQGAMKVGDLRPVRDIIDVRDGVDAILLLIEAGQTGEVYNICSGTGITIQSILDTYCRLARVPISVEQDEALIRPLEHRSKIGDPAKIQSLGWRMRHKVEGTLGEILDYWRTVPG